MEEVKLNDYIVKVDIEKTIELYKSFPKVSEKAHCGCMIWNRSYKRSRSLKSNPQ